MAGNWFSCDPGAENWSFHPSEAAGRSPFAAFPRCHPTGETRRGTYIAAAKLGRESMGEASRETELEAGDPVRPGVLCLQRQITADQ